MAEEPPKKVARRAEASAGVVGFIGLGAMGWGMAKALLGRGFKVHAFDAYPPTLAKAVAELPAASFQGHGSPSDVAGANIEALVLMVVSAAQAEEVLFGEAGAAAALKKGTVVILCSTVSPGAAKALGVELERRGLLFVDAPVSGGVVKAADGTLTIMAGGHGSAFERAKPVLAAMSESLFHVGENSGDGSSVKMVNQLLAGVHIAAAAEAMSLGKRAGLDTRMVFEIIRGAAGNSWMFENRVPRMLDEEYSPAKSQINIWVKDLGIVLGEARDLTFPCPLAAAAHQQYLTSAALGHGKLDDSAVVKIFEHATGVRVAAPLPKPGQKHGWPVQSLKQSLAALPEVLDPQSGQNQVRELIRSGRAPKLVVLDDDPTGTQTVNGVTVLTEWSEAAIAKQLRGKAPGFFILTNSRALPTERARALTKTICTDVRAAAESAGVRCTIVLRGDSTLRGHYPAEVDAVAEALGDFDATVICPFFLQGGRYTIDDVHYVASGDRLSPAADTEFAQDKAFGYHESNLRDWVEEKTKGRVKAMDVASITIEELRRGGPETVQRRIEALPKGAVLVVNAAAEADLSAFAAGLLLAEASGRRLICRTAASFVSARIGIDASSSRPVTPLSLPAPASAPKLQAAGGLVMVGSYVAKSTAQTEALVSRRRGKLDVVELSVPLILQQGGSEEQASKAAELVDKSLLAGVDVLVVTSRALVHGATAEESLDIGNRVSECLVQTLRKVQTRPRYLLAKGGITSSDLATKGLEVKDALVAGQASPGVPVWLLGSGSRWGGLPYVVFPGNVGTIESLSEVVEAWSASTSAESLGWWA